MNLGETELCEMTESVWSAMLGLDVHACRDGSLPSRELVRAVVRIAGAWNGAVVVECEAALASRAAAAMLGVDAGAPTSVQGAEALAEITNQISGNLKALLPEPCELSLPCATFDGRQTPEQGQLAAQATFECSGELFAVSVIERSDDSRPGEA